VKTCLLKNQKGTELVEFAIVALLLFLLLFGIIDFSILLYDKAVITNASREGARAGIVQRWDNTTNPATYDPLDATEIQSVVNAYVANNLITFGGSVTPTTLVTDTILPGTAGLTPELSGGFGTRDQRAVTVTYSYFFLAPGFIAGPSITLSSTTIMRME
jgi:Flp pilus assembly protein TadG